MSAENDAFAALTASLIMQPAEPAPTETAPEQQQQASESNDPGQHETETAEAGAEAALAQPEPETQPEPEREPDWKQAAAKERARRQALVEQRAENQRMQAELQAAKAEAERLQRIRTRIAQGDVGALEELGTDYDSLTGAYINAKDQEVKSGKVVDPEVAELRQTVHQLKASIEAQQAEATQREVQGFYAEVDAVTDSQELELLKTEPKAKNLVAAIFVEATKQAIPMSVAEACERAEKFLEQRETERLAKLKATKKFSAQFGASKNEPAKTPAPQSTVTLTPDLRQSPTGQMQPTEEKAAFAAMVQRIIKTQAAN